MFGNVATMLGAYKSSAVKAGGALLRNWVMIPATMLAGGCYILCISLFGGGSFVGGLFVGMVQIVLISLYYCWLKSSIEREKLGWKDLIALDGSVFNAVINTAFLLFVVKFFISMLIQGMNLDWVLLMLQFGIIIFLNPLPEIVYYHRNDGMNAIQEAFEFVKENWVEWYIPFVALLVPWIFLAPSALLSGIARMDEMLPASILVMTFQGVARFLPLDGASMGIVGLVFGIIAMNWFMIFRGFLFKELESGSLRARSFRRRA